MQIERGYNFDSIEFNKQFYFFLLKVVVSGDIQLTDCDICCKRWYVTFDGKECSAPLPIDGVIYVNRGKAFNLHRPGVIRGHCNIPRNGKVNVEFRVGNCNRYAAGGDAFTGWNSISRIYIEEVNSPQA